MKVRARKPLSRGHFGLDILRPHRWLVGEALNYQPPLSQLKSSKWISLNYEDDANNECVANFKLTIIFQPSSQSPSSEANATNDCARFVFKTIKIKAKNWSLRLLHMVGTSLSCCRPQLRPHYHSHCHHFRLDHNNHQPHPCNQNWNLSKKFTRPNFRAKEFYTLKTRNSRLCSPAKMHHRQ